MPLLENLGHSHSCRRHIACVSHLNVDWLHALERDEILHDRNRNQDCFISDFSLPEAACLFAKCSDYRKLQLVNLDRLADRGALAAKNSYSQFVRQQRDMLAQANIAVVESPALDNHQIADIGVMRIDTIDTDVADLPVHDQLTVIRNYCRSGDDLSAQRIAESLHVGEVDEIGLYVGVVF